MNHDGHDPIDLEFGPFFLISYLIHEADLEERFDPCSAFTSSHLPTVLVAFPVPLAFMKE